MSTHNCAHAYELEGTLYVIQDTFADVTSARKSFPTKMLTECAAACAKAGNRKHFCVIEKGVCFVDLDLGVTFINDNKAKTLIATPGK